MNSVLLCFSELTCYELKSFSLVLLKLETVKPANTDLNFYFIVQGLTVSNKARDATPSDPDSHYTSCKMGVARMAIRCGDLRRGLDICQRSELKTNKTLQRDCAEILGNDQF